MRFAVQHANNYSYPLHCPDIFCRWHKMMGEHSKWLQPGGFILVQGPPPVLLLHGKWTDNWAMCPFSWIKFQRWNGLGPQPSSWSTALQFNTRTLLLPTASPQYQYLLSVAWNDERTLQPCQRFHYGTAGPHLCFFIFMESEQRTGQSKCSPFSWIKLQRWQGLGPAVKHLAQTK